MTFWPSRASSDHLGLESQEDHLRPGQSLSPQCPDLLHPTREPLPMTSRAPKNPLSGRRTSRLRGKERRREAEKLRAGLPASDPPQRLTTETDHSSRRHASGALPERRASLIPELAKLLPETLRSETRARQLLSRASAGKSPRLTTCPTSRFSRLWPQAPKDAGSSLPKAGRSIPRPRRRAEAEPRQPASPNGILTAQAYGTRSR